MQSTAVGCCRMSIALQNTVSFFISVFRCLSSSHICFPIYQHTTYNIQYTHYTANGMEFHICMKVCIWNSFFTRSIFCKALIEKWLWVISLRLLFRIHMDDWLRLIIHVLQVFCDAMIIRSAFNEIVQVVYTIVNTTSIIVSILNPIWDQNDSRQDENKGKKFRWIVHFDVFG